MAVRLASDMSLWLCRAIPPTAIYDFPTIARLARGVLESADSRASAASIHRARSEQQRVARLLRAVEALSDEEVAVLTEDAEERLQ
jgi:hypothetical protein